MALKLTYRPAAAGDPVVPAGLDRGESRRKFLREACTHPSASRLQLVAIDLDAGDEMLLAGTLPALDVLDLSDSDAATLKTVLKKGALPPCRLLTIERLAGGRLDGKALAGFAASDAIRSLEAFALADVPFGSSVAALEGFPPLRTLALPRDGLGPKAVARLVGLPWFAGVRELNLSGNPIGGEGLRRLAAAIAPDSPLETLTLGYCKVGRKAFPGLAALAPKLGRLKRLDVAAFPLADADLLALVGMLPALETMVAPVKRRETFAAAKAINGGLELTRPLSPEEVLLRAIFAEKS